MWFYFAINVGALISTVALPMIRDNHGYAIAFQFPAWLMVISLAVFAAGKNHYAKETLSYQPPTPEERRERTATLTRLFGIFLLMVLFWVPYEHNDSIWVFFSRDYVNLTVPLTQITFAPDQLQFLNPLCVMIFAPLFAWLFPKIDPDVRFFTDKMKILLGFVCGTASSAIMTGAGYLANPDTKISMMWVVSAYVLLTIAEVLVYGTGLDLAFSEAPANMKGFITGCFLLTTTLANFFNSVWVSFYGGSLTEEAAQRGPLLPGPFFGLSGLFAVAALVVMLIMMLTAKPKSHEPA
jgi:POT family proton-dependent oligopeptide transporter